jgi:hypothetical protein
MKNFTNPCVCENVVEIKIHRQGIITANPALPLPPSPNLGQACSYHFSWERGHLQLHILGECLKWGDCVGIHDEFQMNSRESEEKAAIG